MSWWTKLKIIRTIMYSLLALILINYILFDTFPTLYPEWFRNIVGFVGLIIIVLWCVWIIVYLIKNRKNKR